MQTSFPDITIRKVKALWTYYIKSILYLRHFEKTISFYQQGYELSYLVVEVLLFQYQRERQRSPKIERLRPLQINF